MHKGWRNWKRTFKAAVSAPFPSIYTHWIGSFAVEILVNNGGISVVVDDSFRLFFPTRLLDIDFFFLLFHLRVSSLRYSVESVGTFMECEIFAVSAKFGGAK